MDLPGTVKRRELDGEGLWRWTPVSFGLREDGIVAAKDLKQWSVIVDARAWRAASEKGAWTRANARCDGVGAQTRRRDDCRSGSANW